MLPAFQIATRSLAALLVKRIVIDWEEPVQPLRIDSGSICSVYV